jgi:hypothetical protein
MLATSEPIRPGELATLFVLIPPHSDPRHELKPVGVWMDPPTAAAFDRPIRVDVLTAGETVDLCGALAPCVRLVVQNRSAETAVFRAEIELAPDLSSIEHDLGNMIEATWRQGRDYPDRPLFSPHDAHALAREPQGRVWLR